MSAFLWELAFKIGAPLVALTAFFLAGIVRGGQRKLDQVIDQDKAQGDEIRKNVKKVLQDAEKIDPSMSDRELDNRLQRARARAARHKERDL